MSSGGEEKRDPDPAASSAGSQSEVAALIAAFEAKERRASGGESRANEPAKLDPFAGGTSQPIPVVALSAAAANVSDMEALIAQASGSGDVPTQPAAEPDLGLDRAFAELSSVAADDVLVPVSEEDVEANTVESPDADEIIAGPLADEELTKSVDAIVPEATQSTDDVALASVPDDEGPESESEPDRMDEILAALPDAEAEIRGLHPVIDAEADAEADAAAGLPPAAPVVDTVTQTSVIEEIGSENVAAGAAGAASEFTAPRTEEVAPAAETPRGAVPSAKPANDNESASEKDASSAAESPAVAKRWLPPSMLAIAMEQPARAAAAIGLGVFAGVLAFAFLSNNPLRRYEVTAGEEVPSEVTLARAFRMAQALMEQRDYNGVIKMIDTALQHATPQEEGYADALFLRAEAMVRAAPKELTTAEANALHAAIDNAVEAGHEHPKTPEALMWKADVYERENNIPAARAELRGILDNYANSPSRDAVLLALSELEFRSNRLDEALDVAQRMLDEHPKSKFTARARIIQGDIYAAHGNPTAARAVYLLATAEHPDSTAAVAAGERLGKLALASGKPEAAIEELERRLDTATTVEGNDIIYLVLARAYRAVSQPEKARNILNELIEFFPESQVTPVALVELSQVLEELGLRAEAGRMADRAAERYPTNPDVLRHAGQLLADRGEPVGAARKLLAAYDAGAHDPALLLSAANDLLKGGEVKEAQSVYARVAEEHSGSPESIEAQIGWAQAARSLGDVEGAFVRLEELANANEGRPSQLAVLRALADLYHELGLEGEMIEAYGKMASVTDEPAILAEATERLIDAGAADEAMQVAKRVDATRLDPPQAYAFLNAEASVLLRKNADEALALLMRAHDQYPDQRTTQGVETTLRAALTLGRSAQARALVADLKERVDAPDRAAERPIFERSAVQYADFLYRRGDYTGASDAYAMLAPPTISTPVASDGGRATDVAATKESDAQKWAAYQRANAMYAGGNLVESLPLYDAIAASDSPYSGDAKARTTLVRYELRRRGEPDPTAPAESAS